LFGDTERVGKRVTTFAQPHQGKRRRQVDGFRYERPSAYGRRQAVLQLPFLPY
jgi:hypothetical protein